MLEESRWSCEEWLALQTFLSIFMRFFWRTSDSKVGTLSSVSWFVSEGVGGQMSYSGTEIYSYNT